MILDSESEDYIEDDIFFKTIMLDINDEYEDYKFFLNFLFVWRIEVYINIILLWALAFLVMT